MKVEVILLAAGRSERFGQDKLWINFQGRPLWLHSYQTFLAHPRITGIAIVCQPGKLEDFRGLAPGARVIQEGGSTRQESSKIGISSLASDCEIVLIHDAARPFVTSDLIDRVIEGAAEAGACFPALAVTDTLRVALGEGHWDTPDRSQFVSVQTPQGFQKSVIAEAAKGAKGEFTDDVGMVLELGGRVVQVPGSSLNRKITYQEDLPMLTAFRTGFGYDIHAFSNDPERVLWLGGVSFPGQRALDGHSDADVLIHAIVDALLGSVGLGDIGQLYPNTDEAWRGCRSEIFLMESADRLTKLGWQIQNIDATVIAEVPKIVPRTFEMREFIAKACQVSLDQVSIKATTNEKLGALGKEEGIAAHAIATVAR